MERFLFQRFLSKTRLGRLGNELQEATFEGPDHFSFESAQKLANKAFVVKFNVTFLLIVNID